MNKVILLLFIACSAYLDLNAQGKDVLVQINHFLGNEDIEAGESAYNNMNHKFMLNRLQYYLSEITIQHDNGQNTKIDDLWVLVNALEGSTVIELGSLQVDNIEGLSFFIGVDPDHNHLDPTTWPSSHPLAPQAPSMHWGWAAGYRFVALEGYGGDDLNRKIEIHGLGDINYGQTTIRKSSVVVDGKHVLYIDADYTKALNDISVQSGLIVHAENFQASTCLSNFKNQVFTAGQGTTSTEDGFENESINVYPNPNNGAFKIDLGEMDDRINTIQVVDIEGRLILELDKQDFTNEITIKLPGKYLLMLEGENGILGVKHFSVF